MCGLAKRLKANDYAGLSAGDEGLNSAKYFFVEKQIYVCSYIVQFVGAGNLGPVVVPHMCLGPRLDPLLSGEEVFAND